MGARDPQIQPRVAARIRSWQRQRARPGSEVGHGRQRARSWLLLQVRYHVKPHDVPTIGAHRVGRIRLAPAKSVDLPVRLKAIGSMMPPERTRLITFLCISRGVGVLVGRLDRLYHHVGRSGLAFAGTCEMYYAATETLGCFAGK